EKAPITSVQESEVQETYTFQMPSVDFVCGREFKYDVSYDDPFWLDDPVIGEPNTLKRTAYIHNYENTRGNFGFDMIYLVDGEIIERTLNPSMSWVEKDGVRRLFLLWNTEYDPKKDVRIDVIDVPEIEAGAEPCEKVVTYVNRTGVRNKTVTSESTSYENVIKTKTITVCD
ncbi:MAG: hypothetical protein ACE5DM_00970, partial [Candidatus Nanoarchaeia archaeon]